MTASGATDSQWTVVRLALRARVLAAIRGGLSAAGAAAAVLAGAEADPALLGWLVGALLVSIILAGDRRGRLDMTTERLPDEAGLESWAEIARTDTFPSTVGVAILCVAALAFNPVLAAMMAGILGGMALMTSLSWVQVALAERTLGGLLYLERASRRLYISMPPAR